MRLHEFAENGGSVFAKLAVIRAESGKEMGVDVEFPDNLSVHENRHHDFGFGFERAGKIAGICIHVADDNGSAGGGRSATDALVQGNSRVGRHCALIGAKHEDVTIALFFEHVEADPVVTGKLFVEK